MGGAGKEREAARQVGRRPAPYEAGAADHRRVLIAGCRDVPSPSTTPSRRPRGRRDVSAGGQTAPPVATRMKAAPARTESSICPFIRDDQPPAETSRRCRPSKRRRTPSGTSLRNVEETAKDKVTEVWEGSSAKVAVITVSGPSRHRAVETTQTLYDNLRRPRRRRVVSAAARSLRSSPRLGVAIARSNFRISEPEFRFPLTQ